MKKYTIGLPKKALLKSMDWREMLRCAKECGYNFLEISIDETDMRLSRLARTKQQRLAQVGTNREIDEVALYTITE